MSRKANDDHIRKTPTSDPYHSFLESLKGKEVTIYRGGPESKSGVLLDVQQDFVTVYAQNNNNNNNNDNNQNNAQNNNNNQNQNTVVYYNIRHIASISENSVNNSTLNLQQELTTEDPDFIRATTFTGVAKQLKNKYIQINQGGPEKKTGLVLDVVDDYIVLFAEDDGVVYFNVNHVKSIYEYNQNNNQDENSTTVIPEFEKTNTFHDLFGRMAHKWIAINRGGPEAMEGILVENIGGHYTLINNQEVMRINPYHIKSISSGPKGSLKQNNQNNQEQENTEATAQANEEQHHSEENQSESTTSSSGRSTRSNRSHRTYREKVVKSIDYVWRAK